MNDPTLKDLYELTTNLVELMTDREGVLAEHSEVLRDHTERLNRIENKLDGLIEAMYEQEVLTFGLQEA